MAVTDSTRYNAVGYDLIEIELPANDIRRST
jgi:hypothetical protein